MTVIDTYTLQIVRDPDADPYAPILTATATAILEAEENMELLLPDGYRAVIRRWDEGDEDA